MKNLNKTQSARERILETASRLFYQQGFQAVGINTIIAESGIAKMTLYRYFPSKDDLIVAYLERSNQKFWEWIALETDGKTKPKEKLLKIFQAIEQLANQPTCFGCTFQNTAAEFQNLSHPGHQAALNHKQQVLTYLEDLSKQAGHKKPKILAKQLLMLMDGAWMAARMFGPENPATQVGSAAKVLIEKAEAVSSL